MRVLLRTVGVLLIAVLLAGAAGAAYFFWRYPAVGPAPEARLERNGPMVERGKYLANHVCVCIDCHSTRDTCRRQAPRRGFEPDSCFYVQHEALVRGKKRLDLKIDPPPDLAIDIEITSGAIPKLPISAALGVPEVWRHDGERLRMFVLETDTSTEQPHSRAFPGLISEAMTDWLVRSRNTPRTALL